MMYSQGSTVTISGNGTGSTGSICPFIGSAGISSDPGIGFNLLGREGTGSVIGSAVGTVKLKTK